MLRRGLQSFTHDPSIDRFFQDHAALLSYVNTRKPHRLLPQRLIGNYHLAESSLQFKEGDSIFSKDKLRIVQLLRDNGLDPPSDVTDVAEWTMRELGSLRPFVRGKFDGTLQAWMGLPDGEQAAAIERREREIGDALRADAIYREELAAKAEAERSDAAAIEQLKVASEVSEIRRKARADKKAEQISSVNRLVQTRAETLRKEKEREKQIAAEQRAVRKRLADEAAGSAQVRGA